MEIARIVLNFKKRLFVDIFNENLTVPKTGFVYYMSLKHLAIEILTKLELETKKSRDNLEQHVSKKDVNVNIKK